MTTANRVTRDGARFYEVDGRLLPSVTTVLGIIDKSGALIGWAVKQERRAFESVMLDALTKVARSRPRRCSRR
jgi:hypothetical protein